MNKLEYTQLIRKGMTGEKVSELTHFLHDINYLANPKEAGWWNIFGSRTEAAVRQFQTDRGIKVDGIVGPETTAALNDYYDKLQADQSDGDTSDADTSKPHTKNFAFREFLCPNGDEIPEQYYPDLQLLMNHLQTLRDLMGVPIIVRSGYRSPAYNPVVGGAKDSQHLYAAAADIYCINRKPDCYTLGQKAYDMFYKGLLGGVGLGSNTDVHVDIRNIKTCSPQRKPAYWWYDGNLSWVQWKASR